MRCKLVHLDASVAPGERAPVRTAMAKTKGGQKGINPNGAHTHTLGWWWDTESFLAIWQILSGDKDNALDYETIHGFGIYLFGKFIYELVRLRRNKERQPTGPTKSLKCKRKRASRTWSCCCFCFCGWLTSVWLASLSTGGCRVPGPAGNQRLNKQLTSRHFKSSPAARVHLKVEVCNFWY